MLNLYKGTITYHQKDILIEKCTQNQNNKIKNNAIKLIRDYTTLDDYKSTDSRIRALTRFISK